MQAYERTCYTPSVFFLQWPCWGTDNQDGHALLYEFHQELLSRCSVPTPILPGCYYRLQDLIPMLLRSKGEATKLCLQESCQDCKVKSRLLSKCKLSVWLSQQRQHQIWLWGWISGLAALHTAPYQGQNLLIPTTQPTYSQTEQLPFEPKD